MLRRLKRDVETEIGPKREHEVYCSMTHRQKILYRRIKEKISTKDLFQLVNSQAKVENLMNLVMQFRKVCNHPDLFERRMGKVPFMFSELQIGVNPNYSLSSNPHVRHSRKNPIAFYVPSLIYDECYLPSDNQNTHFKKLIPYTDIEFCEVGVETHFKFFNIFNEVHLNEELYTSGSNLGILRLLQVSNKWSLNELAYLFVADKLVTIVALAHHYAQQYKRNMYKS